MSSFGQYVHLSASKYKEFGTVEEETWHDRQDRQPNFKENIFKQHKALILAEATSLKKANIKAMEAEYNKNNQLSIEKLREVVNNKQGSILYELLATVQKTWTPARIRDVMNNGYLDETGRWVYTGHGGENAEQASATKGIAKMPIPSGRKKIDTILKACDNLKKKLASSPNAELDILITNLLQLKEIKKSNKKIEEQVNLSSTPAGYLENYEAIAYVRKYNQILESYETIDDINNTLSWRFPEILGSLSEHGINTVKDKALKKIFQEIQMSNTGTQSTRSNMLVQQYLLLDKVTLNQLANDTFYKQGLLETKKRSNKSSYSLKSVGSGVSQKADVLFTFSDQPSTPIGISMKGSNMSKQGDIHLQNSSLLLYLMGIQQQEEDLGTHYLNILASHKQDEASGILKTMRQDANQSLTLAILFSALTGRNQLRLGGWAEILAIYDKATVNGIAKVHFFDVSDIIISANRQLSKFSLYHDVSAISLANEQVGNTASFADAKKRITKLIVQARVETLSATLSKSFLSSLGKNLTP